MNEPFWVGKRIRGLKVWRVKHESPAEARAFLRRIDFGLGGFGWVDRRDLHGITHEARLKTPGHVVGLRDAETVSHLSWAEEWRASMHETIRDEIAVRQGAVT